MVDCCPRAAQKAKPQSSAVIAVLEPVRMFHSDAESGGAVVTIVQQPRWPAKAIFHWDLRFLEFPAELLAARNIHMSRILQELTGRQFCCIDSPPLVLPVWHVGILHSNQCSGYF